MDLKRAMSRLEALGTEQMRKMNVKNGAGDNQFGVKMGDLRVLAKEFKTDPELAKKLWSTGNADARLLSILITKPKQLSKEELDEMVRSADYPQLAEWLTSYVIKVHASKEELRRCWMSDRDPAAYRAGWSLTAERIEKDPEGIDIDGLLDRIEKEMANAHELPKWTMNWAL